MVVTVHSARRLAPGNTAFHVPPLADPASLVQSIDFKGIYCDARVHRLVPGAVCFMRPPQYEECSWTPYAGLCYSLQNDLRQPVSPRYGPRSPVA